MAISNRRVLCADAQRVTFAYKDYADQARSKTMTLDTPEFVRRFCLHILPRGFVKIRHYGLLGNRQGRQRLACARQLLAGAQTLHREPPTGAAPAREPPPRRCPFCQQLTLVFVREVAPAPVQRPALLDSS